MNDCPNAKSSAVAIAFWLLSSFGVALAGNASLPVSQVSRIRQENRQRFDNILNAELRETILESRDTQFGAEEKRQGTVQRILAWKEMSIRGARMAGMPESRIAEIEEHATRNIDGLDDAETVEFLNTHTLIARTTAFDLQQRRIRRDDRDLRDIDALVVEHGLTGGQRQSLEKSGTTIAIGDKPEIRMWPHVSKAAYRMSHRSVNLDTEFRRLGAIPSAVFESGYQLEMAGDENGSDLRIVGRTSAGQIEFIVAVAPECGFAMSGLTIYKDGRVIEEYFASDFRPVGGIHIPYRTTTIMSERAPNYYVATRAVNWVEVNGLGDRIEKLYTIPSDFEVHDFSKQ